MYLYLASNPRVLYLATTHHDEKLGRPERVLVFKEGENPSQAVVEFVPKKEVDLNSLVRLTNRVVKGCLGLISVDNGVHHNILCSCWPNVFRPLRCLSCSRHERNRSWQYQAICTFPRVCSQNTRR